jgi:hypothetical protein
MRYLIIQNSESEGSTGAHVHQIPSPANFLSLFKCRALWSSIFKIRKCYLRYIARFLKLENVIWGTKSMENNYVDTYICDLHFVKFCKKYTIYLGMWKIKKIMVQKGKKTWFWSLLVFLCRSHLSIFMDKSFHAILCKYLCVFTSLVFEVRFSKKLKYRARELGS